MTRINLLPWREARRLRQKRNFVSLIIAGVVIAAIGVLITHLYVAGLIEHQQQRNQYLRNEITKLNKVEREIQEMKQAEDSLAARLEVIQRLQRGRPDMVKVLDALVRYLPEDVYLNSIQAQGKQLTLNGNARINNVVSDFMRELENSSIFGEPKLRIVENKSVADNVPVSRFDLVVNQVPRSAPGPDGGAAQ